MLIAAACGGDNADDAEFESADRSAIFAAVAHERALGNPTYDPAQIIVVERLGQFDEDLPTVDAVSAPGAGLTDDERAAIESALAPYDVRWVTPAAAEALITAADPDAPEGALVTFVVTLTEPDIDGNPAFVRFGRDRAGRILTKAGSARRGQTSSMRAISAASPCRAPSLRTRV